MKIIILAALAAAGLCAQEIDYARQVVNTPAVDARRYNWSRTHLLGAQADLSSTGSKTITVTPCPKGVSGSGVAQYVRISGGSGTAEVALITGGSCTSGAATGTIAVTTVATHTGAWAVSSATSGIQEAVKIAEVSGPASVVISNGTYPVYAPIRVRQAGIGIQAVTDFGATIDASNMLTGNVFEFHAAGSGFENISIRGLRIYASSKTSGAGVSVDSAYNFHADKMVITGIPDGIIFNASYLVYVTDCVINRLKAATGRGVSYDGGGANIRILRSQIEGDISGNPALQPLAGIEIKQAGGIWITDVDVIGCGKDLFIHPGSGTAASWGFVVNSSFDTAAYGIYIAPEGTGEAQGWNFTNSWSASHLFSGVLIDAPTASQTTGISFVNHRSSNNQFYGFDVVNGVNINISDSQVWGNNQSNTANITAIQIHPNISNVKITGNSFAPPSNFPKHHAAHIAVSAGTGDNYVITGNDVTDTFSVAPILFSATGTHHIIHSNLGVNTLFPPAVASASTIALGDIPYDAIAVTGTTSVTNITPGWEGRELLILKSDAGTVAFNGGGNIANAFSLSIGGIEKCRFINGGWWCK